MSVLNGSTFSAIPSGTDEETDAWPGEGTWPRSHSLLEAQLQCEGS